MTHGPVLELGCGFSSTPFLYWLCQDQGRKFVSYDNDEGWIKKLGYPIVYVGNWDKAEIINVHWSVAFIDHRPGERRVVDAAKLKNKADYIILHDSEPQLDKFYGYEKIYPLFKYRFDYTKFLPQTTILSNYFDPAKIYK